MKQVLVKGGKVHLETVPPPALEAGMLLVQVHYSLISAGTESGLVSGGGAAAYALKKARDPLNIEKVKRKIASVGLKATLEVVRGKLLEFQAPGYSTAGVVVACGAGVHGFRAGDRVACAGAGYASHAEYNAVPHQLVTPLPDGVDFQEGAFVALGAIAMQGLRRARPTFGETIVVIGLGLVGQLAAQLARAAGCHVIGCDPIASRRVLAAELGAEAVCAPEGLDDTVHEWSGGHGADAVIVCAASKDSAIANQAIECCRPRGRVSVVGAVGMHLERDALYHQEIDFALSCSYGPGRYQSAYEEKGLDYPIGHVRWTEGRNMQEFLRMLASGQVRAKPLIGRVDGVDEAAAAYDAILTGEGETIAALIHYGGVDAVDAADSRAVERPDPVLRLQASSAPAGSIGVAVLGTGGFAQGIHLPNLRQIDGCHLQAVVSRTGSAAKQAGERFGAAWCTTDYDAVLADPDVHAVIIATRHHRHADQALAALDAGKHVFIEKPMALTVADCEAVCAKAAETGLLVSVGYNRRLSAHAQAAKTTMAKMPGPRQVLYRCNAGPLPEDHWTRDPDIGGGRILGEAVHFFDFCCWLLDADPVSVVAEAPGLAPANDDLTAILRYADGSLATIIYTTSGNQAAGKERIEIHGGGGTIIIDNFRGIQFHGVPGKSTRPGKEDKGQRALLESFIRAVRGEGELAVTAHDGLRATRLALEAIAAARGNTSTPEQSKSTAPPPESHTP